MDISTSVDLIKKSSLDGRRLSSFNIAVCDRVRRLVRQGVSFCKRFWVCAGLLFLLSGAFFQGEVVRGWVRDSGGYISSRENMGK